MLFIVCFQTSSYLDVTPSPSKLLTDHPLGAFIKTEVKEEEEEKEEVEVEGAVAAASVKQEEEVDLPVVKVEEGMEVLAEPPAPSD